MENQDQTCGNGSSGSVGSASSFPAWVVIACLFISVVGIVDHDLWTPDEPREAAIALSMSRTGDWIVPRLVDQPFVEKPPLYYNVSAMFLRVLAPCLGNTVALRLTSVFWGLGTLAMTWLLARRLFNRQLALLSVLVLATMPGFVQVTHWLLVDNALVFFSVAALWGLAEAYRGRRLAFLPVAGLFAACAFLVKGAVGPAVIALGWIGLFIAWVGEDKWRKVFSARSVLFHIIGLLVFCAPVLAWMVAFRAQAGAELWHEWWWVNHIGRFMGSATQKGHISGPFYYLGVLPIYVLPWLAVLITAFVRAIAHIRRRKPLGNQTLFLLWWIVGGMLLLSLSATKREIYLAVLLPALAMLTAATLQGAAGKWVKYSLKVWLGICVVALGLLMLVPLLGSGIRKTISYWPVFSGLAFTGLAVAYCLIRGKGQQYLSKWFAVTAFTYIIVLVLMCPVIDRWKSYGPAFRQMAEALGNDPSARVAGWNFDETTRAGFYYYCNLAVPRIPDIVALQCVLKADDPRYNGVIVFSKKGFPPKGVLLPPYDVKARVHMGPKRVLLWIKATEKPE